MNFFRYARHLIQYTFLNHRKPDIRCKLLLSKLPPNYDYNSKYLLEPTCAAVYHQKLVTKEESSAAPTNKKDSKPPTSKLDINQPPPPKSDEGQPASDKPQSIVNKTDNSRSESDSSKPQLPKSDKWQPASDKPQSTVNHSSSESECSQPPKCSNHTPRPPGSQLQDLLIQKNKNECPHCGKVYAHASSLSKHISKTHSECKGDTRNIICNKCGIIKIFVSQNSYYLLYLGSLPLQS